MTNHWKDRHVLAAAIHAGAETIVTFNLRDFRSTDLEPWDVRVLHPQDFLIELWRQCPVEVFSKLERQAADRGRDLAQLLKVLGKTVPDFVDVVLRG